MPIARGVGLYIISHLLSLVFSKNTESSTREVKEEQGGVVIG